MRIYSITATKKGKAAWLLCLAHLLVIALEELQRRNFNENHVFTTKLQPNHNMFALALIRSFFYDYLVLAVFLERKGCLWVITRIFFIWSLTRQSSLLTDFYLLSC